MKHYNDLSHWGSGRPAHSPVEVPAPRPIDLGLVALLTMPSLCPHGYMTGGSLHQVCPICVEDIDNASGLIPDRRPESRAPEPRE